MTAWRRRRRWRQRTGVKSADRRPTARFRATVRGCPGTFRWLPADAVRESRRDPAGPAGNPCFYRAFLSLAPHSIRRFDRPPAPRPPDRRAGAGDGDRARVRDRAVHHPRVRAEEGAAPAARGGARGRAARGVADRRTRADLRRGAAARAGGDRLRQPRAGAGRACSPGCSRRARRCRVGGRRRWPSRSRRSASSARRRRCCTGRRRCGRRCATASTCRPTRRPAAPPRPRRCCGRHGVGGFTEREMARLSLTGERGTPLLGVYRGLFLAAEAAGSPLRPGFHRLERRRPARPARAAARDGERPADPGARPA